MTWTVITRPSSVVTSTVTSIVTSVSTTTSEVLLSLGTDDFSNVSTLADFQGDLEDRSPTPGSPQFTGYSYNSASGLNWRLGFGAVSSTNNAYGFARCEMSPALSGDNQGVKALVFRPAVNVGFGLTPLCKPTDDGTLVGERYWARVDFELETGTQHRATLQVYEGDPSVATVVPNSLTTTVDHPDSTTRWYRTIVSGNTIRAWQSVTTDGPWTEFGVFTVPSATMASLRSNGAAAVGISGNAAFGNRAFFGWISPLELSVSTSTSLVTSIVTSVITSGSTTVTWVSTTPPSQSGSTQEYIVLSSETGFWWRAYPEDADSRLQVTSLSHPWIVTSDRPVQLVTPALEAP